LGKLTLQEVINGSHFFSGRLSIGAYIKNNIATLIDSGIDEGTAKSVNQALESNNIIVGSIINTHSHADHCGGNNFFQKKYPNLRIYSSKYEQAFIEDPRLEPICFCASAAPFLELRNKHLEAPPSRVTDVITPYEDTVIKIQDESFRIITLPGHTPGMIGVITPDDVFYCGDAIFGEDTFKKHGILFYTNIEDTLTTFQKIEKMKVKNTVFYHGGLLEGDLADVAIQHTKKIIETKDRIFSFINELKTPSVDLLTQKVINSLGIPQDIVQFTLTKTCVNAYVTQLQKEKAIELKVNNGLLEITPKDSSANEKSVQKEKKVIKADSNNFQLSQLQGNVDVLGTYTFNEDQKSIKIYFKEKKLQGRDIHVDMELLSAIDCLYGFLMHQGIISKEQSKIIEKEQGSLYVGAIVKYQPNLFTKISPTNMYGEKAPHSSINLTSDYIQLTIEEEVPPNWKDILSSQLTNLSLKDNTAAHHSKLGF